MFAHFQAEKLFKQALKASEALLRNNATVNPDTKEEALHSEWKFLMIKLC